MARAPPPVLAIEMLNPANERRPLMQLFIALLVYATVRLIGRELSPMLATVLTTLALMALPASIGALAMGDSLWQAINPMTLWHLARALRWTYVGIVAISLFYGATLLLLRASPLPTLWLAAAAMFAWLSVYALIGGSLFEARAAVGHEPIDTPERRAARLQRELEHERSRFIDHVYGQARGGNLAGAWQSIERELSSQRHAFEYYDWLLQRLEMLGIARLTNRLAQDYVSRALSRDNTRVTRLVQHQLKADPSFRPRSAAETLRVAELARLAGDRASAQSLLGDFAQQFPGDAAIGRAHSLAESLRRDI